MKQNGQLGTPKWTRVRNQGQGWKRGELRIKNMQGNYQIVIEAIVGVSLGVIAVDDIRLLNECPIKTNRFCDFEQDDLCGYTNLNSGNLKWQRGTPSVTQGPSIDQ